MKKIILLFAMAIIVSGCELKKLDWDKFIDENKTDRESVDSDSEETVDTETPETDTETPEIDHEIIVDEEIPDTENDEIIEVDEDAQDNELIDDSEPIEPDENEVDEDVVSVDPEMVIIPAGAFWMGCNETIDTLCEEDEKPYHEVILPSFYIDKYEVTVKDYKDCVSASICEPTPIGGPCTWDLPGGDSFPINCVLWAEAKKYCEWKGKRLPTEAEWEKAARGTDERIYPWGNDEPTCDYAVIKGDGEGCASDTAFPVGSKPLGVSPYGAYDMAGNQWEYCNDWYDSGYYENSSILNPEGSAEGTVKVMRGGSFSPYDFRASNREYYNTINANNANNSFRCVKDIENESSCYQNPCSGVSNSDEVCIVDGEIFKCGCLTGFIWEDYQCIPHNEWIKIDLGGYHSCGITNSNELWCWGENAWGQLGIGDKEQKLSPVKVDNNLWKEVSAGNEHTCAILKDNNLLYCWGKNNFGEIGHEVQYFEYSETPVYVNSFEWLTVSTGWLHTCGITIDNDLYCWGHGTYGELGDGLESTHQTPTHIGTEKWKSIASGYGFTCGLKQDNKLYCWGNNNEGELGTGTSGSETSKNVPTKVSDDQWSTLKVGSSHTCAQKLSDDKIYCWGWNSSGQLGVGSYDMKDSPTLVSNDEWTDIELGYAHTCGIKKSDNKLYCWGLNTYGQLGDGTGGTVDPSEKKNVPTLVDNSDWGILSLGQSHTCSVDLESKELKCWGRGTHGIIGNGDGSDVNYNTPQRVDFTY